MASYEGKTNSPLTSETTPNCALLPLNMEALSPLILSIILSRHLLVEHSIPANSTTNPETTRPPRRPDLSTFFSTLELVDTSSTNNEHALPIPGDVSAAFRTLADAFERMRQDQEGGERTGHGQGQGGGGVGGGMLLEEMVQQLLGEAEMPPKKVQGVSDEFMAGE